ncbi:MAG: MFS transporter [Chloroflexota bacterium]
MRRASDPRLGFIGYLKLTVMGFALSALWSSLHAIVLPMRLLDLVAETRKNSYLGLLTFSGLVVAMVTQPLVGALSDRTRFTFGRRRPYLLTGTVLALLILPFLGLAGSYFALFLSYLFLQFATNTAQAPYQAFIPELVPSAERGRASGVKSMLEILGGVVLLYPVARLMDDYATTHESSGLFFSLGMMGALILIAGVVTVTLIEETLPAEKIHGIPGLRSYLKTRLWRDTGLRYYLLSRLLFFSPSPPSRLSPCIFSVMWSG